jgi:hypothetical protein
VKFDFHCFVISSFCCGPYRFSAQLAFLLYCSCSCLTQDKVGYKFICWIWTLGLWKKYPLRVVIVPIFMWYDNMIKFCCNNQLYPTSRKYTAFMSYNLSMTKVAFPITSKTNLSSNDVVLFKTCVFFCASSYITTIMTYHTTFLKYLFLGWNRSVQHFADDFRLTVWCYVYNSSQNSK